MTLKQIDKKQYLYIESKGGKGSDGQNGGKGGNGGDGGDPYNTDIKDSICL